VSYFRPPKIRKTGPRSICSLPDSTQNLSRKRGWVTLAWAKNISGLMKKGVSVAPTMADSIPVDTQIDSM
jgi:hypothetical protein